MINKATDAVSKMTIKMNESDVVSITPAVSVMTQSYSIHHNVFNGKWLSELMCVVHQWFEDKLQEVENEDQQLRKLHAMVESLVNHRKGRFT